MKSPFPFNQATPIKNKASTNQFWYILVVDDEQDIHEVTELVLGKKIIENKQIKIVSAFSAEQAKEILSQGDIQFAAAFIDVVMESDHAGLDLVKWIRNDLCDNNIRLVLRTGQAGVAPEESVIRDFDINDYKSKTELTSIKLITTTYNAIRSYRDIWIIERSLKGFQSLIQSTNHMLRLRNLKDFGTAALNHLLSLMNLDSSALYIAHLEKDFFNHSKHVVIACTGEFINYSDTLDNSSISDKIREQILSVFENKKSVRSNDYYLGYFETAANTASVLYIEINNTGDYFQTKMLDLYSANLALIFENIIAHRSIEETQRDLMYIIGDAIEARSKETGAHVKRVSMICELLAKKMNQPEVFVKLVKFAAPLHDLGKIAIPENILHKHGKLNDEEWTIMKTHAEIGGELLNKSTSDVSQIAARMARHHHENWDGSGYPDGLKGLEIPLEARLMAVADVFDALGSKRSYKDEWPKEKIKEFIFSQKNIKFESLIVDILLDNFDEFIQIRTKNPD